MYYVLSAIAWLIGRLGERGLDRTARFMAWLGWDLLRMRRKLVQQNIAKAFPDKSATERDKIGKQSYYNFILTTLEFFHGRHHDIADDIEVVGGDHVHQALERGKGVYILCFHMGNWEAMGAKCTRTFAPSRVVVKKVGSPSVDKFVSDLRSKIGFLTIKRQRKGDGFRQIRDTLGKNEIVGFVVDQARPGEPRLPFFGHPAKTNTSFAAIWRRDQAPIVPGYINRVRPGKHVLTFMPEVVPEVTENKEQDILDHSLMFSQVTEQCIRRCPEQYFWLHNRWK